MAKGFNFISIGIGAAQTGDAIWQGFDQYGNAKQGWDNAVKQTNKFAGSLGGCLLDQTDDAGEWGGGEDGFFFFHPKIPTSKKKGGRVFSYGFEGGGGYHSPYWVSQFFFAMRWDSPKCLHLSSTGDPCPNFQPLSLLINCRRPRKGWCFWVPSHCIPQKQDKHT